MSEPGVITLHTYHDFRDIAEAPGPWIGPSVCVRCGAPFNGRTINEACVTHLVHVDDMDAALEAIERDGLPQGLAALDEPDDAW